MNTLSTTPRPPRRWTHALWLLPVAIALLAALLALAPEAPALVGNSGGEATGALPVAALAATAPQRFDDSALRDPSRLAEPEPWPLSVAAYAD